MQDLSDVEEEEPGSDVDIDEAGQISGLF